MTDTSLPRVRPEEAGVSSAAIAAFVSAAEAKIQELHSFMVMKGGKVVAEGWWAPYRPQDPHMLFSLSKSFCSTAAGLAIAEGHFNLDDPVISFFPDDAPDEVSPNLAAMKVRHLLSMATGNDQDTTGSLRSGPDGNWAKAFLACPVEHEPGTHFVYNSGATYMVSAIVQQTTGQRLLDYLQPRLFEPLGIRNPTWDQSPQGIDVGGWGLNITTEDIAKFGQLYLQRGQWNGRQLVPAEWVGLATSKQVSNGDNPESDWNQGYGFQFWRCRHNAYRGDGAFGQFCVVLPDQDAVVAITAGTGDLQGVLNAVWEHLLPGLDGKGSAVAGGAAGTGAGALEEQLASLALKTPEGAATSSRLGEFAGRTYRAEPNDRGIRTIRLESGAAGLVLHVGADGAEDVVPVGTSDRWERGEMTVPGPAVRPVAASGAWSGEDELRVKLCFSTTPFCPVLTFRFEGDTLSLDWRMNVAFGATSEEIIRARA